MSLLDTYRTILSNPDQWRYYQRQRVGDDISNAFEDEYFAKSFIKSYFESGDKSDVFFQLEEGMIRRWNHTLSVFLLGLYLSEALEVNMSEDGNKKNLYLWYLTCLYHDYGYTIENNRNEYQPHELSIHTLFKDKLEGSYYLRKKGMEFSDMTRWQYYDYCRNHLGFINHGIVGGLLLYDRLVKHLNNKIAEHNGQTHFFDEQTHLYYSITQKTDFARCADAIIAHNIWFDDNSPIEELHLNERKHQYKDWLTALLVLCDTIEPTKVFTCCHPKSVLNRVHITRGDNSISITILDNDGCTHQTYFNKCRNLQDWTYCEIHDVSPYQLQISNLRSLYHE